MREVRYWVAWDDTEFETKEECEQYEQHAIMLMTILNDCYTFLTKDKCCILSPATLNIYSWLAWVDNAYETCEYIRITKPLPQEVSDFIRKEWGYCMLQEDFSALTGLFKYNFYRGMWVKVGE